MRTGPGPDRQRVRVIRPNRNGPVYLKVGTFDLNIRHDDLAYRCRPTGRTTPSSKRTISIGGLLRNQRSSAETQSEQSSTSRDRSYRERVSA